MVAGGLIGVLPPGLSLDANGTLSGAPTQAGIFEFTVSADNGIDPAASLQATLVIEEAQCTDSLCGSITLPGS
ncbi:Ig domain-containing protein [Hoyosella sp. YIM 151337]|uniref:Ig domain-containing protein n=1 Tax=Hoyosella sp. YIM 151337 TaxID=2992742 RepID=UPI0035A882D8